MSLKAEKFYALQCDFPECGVLWEGYEYAGNWLTKWGGESK